MVKTSNNAAKTASKRTANAAKQQVNDTKVICPVCGSEFAIGEHEHTVKNATVIGMDSGLGTVVLPVSKRGTILENAGVDTTQFFSINLPTGGKQWMKMQDGVPVAVSADDPVIAQIITSGTVPNRNLFRRWVMSQMFHALTLDGGITEWMRRRYYDYSWKMLVEELCVQARLIAHRDMENFEARNRWFRKSLAITMADDYIEQVRKHCASLPTRKCKGVPYIKFDRRDVFVSDIEKKIIAPLLERRYAIMQARNAQELYEAVEVFWRGRCTGSGCYKQCAAWKDAFKGAGAYFTMQNLIRFHGCTFPKDNAFFKHGRSSLDMLEEAAAAYQNGDGWRLYALMKQMLDFNGIDIEKKIEQWHEAKKRKSA